MEKSREILKKVTIFFVGTILSTACYSHNTNVTHPLLTLEAIRLIENGDKTVNEYSELYRSVQTGFADLADPPDYRGITEYPFYWGVWNTEDWKDPREQRLYKDFDESEKDEDPGFLSLDKPYQTLFTTNKFNVINGVVREDTPATKVLNHFYHAYTAKSLCGVNITGCDNSKNRAMPFLIESANIYGYEAYTDSFTEHDDEWLNIGAYLPTPFDDRAFAKQLAFQSFGEALHHVEDMSSIAHVQGDAHLTSKYTDPILNFIGDSEKDDYEGLYVPNRVFEFHADSNLDNWFVKTRNSSPADIQRVSDIWSPPGNAIDYDRG